MVSLFRKTIEKPPIRVVFFDLEINTIISMIHYGRIRGKYCPLCKTRIKPMNIRCRYCGDYVLGISHIFLLFFFALLLLLIVRFQ